MEIKIQKIIEVKEMRDWTTLELNESDISAMERGDILGFESKGKKYMIVPV